MRWCGCVTGTGTGAGVVVGALRVWPRAHAQVLVRYGCECVRALRV